MTEKEMTFKHEQAAREYRRKLIDQGASVTLIGYDTERDVYAFGIIA